MYLTDKKAGHPRPESEHDELEVLLESFSKQVEEIVNESETTMVCRNSISSRSLTRGSTVQCIIDAGDCRIDFRRESEQSSCAGSESIHHDHGPWCWRLVCRSLRNECTFISFIPYSPPFYSPDCLL